MMWNTILLLLSLISLFPSLQGIEFLYPIALLEDGVTACVIYQKTSTHIELWQWNSITGKMEQLLLTRFTPGGMSLLPNKKAYSFIDNGLIMIKNFIKRSPGSLELSQPLYDISKLYWHSLQHCYTSGKKQNHYGIFQIDTNGITDTILWDNLHDYLYPQKCNNDLFCVERTTFKHASHYRIVKIKYPEIIPTFNINEVSNEKISLLPEIENAEIDSGATIKSPECKTLILDTNVRPVSFLNMISSAEGYYISYQPQISVSRSLMEFDYYHIKQDNEIWSQNRLFTFTIPIDFLFFNQATRLYESILPLIPYHIDGAIYFVNTTLSSHGGNLNLFKFDQSAQSIEQVSHASDENWHCFRPLKIKDQTIYGGSINQQNNDSVSMWIGEDGEIYAQFPHILSTN